MSDATMKGEITLLRQSLERAILRLAACGVAANCNTEAGIKAMRLAPDNEYWSASYGDVCRAVDREIALRGQVNRLEQALRLVRNRLAPAYHCIDDELIAKTLARAEYHIDEVLAAIDKEREGR